MTNRAEIAARALLKAWSDNQPLDVFPDGTAPDSVEAAMAIQDAMVRMTGEVIGAWKVGPATTDYPATSAPISARRVLQAPASLSNTLRRKAVEAEVAFRLGRDLPASDGPYTAEDCRAAVASVMPAIEAVETRYACWPVADRHWALADNQSNEALILGPEIAFANDGLLFGMTGTLDLGGTVKPADRGFPGGDPFGLIAWLAGHLGERDPILAERGLKAGDVITTGSWNGVDFAGDSMTVVADFPGLGSVSIHYG